ncbi:granzyme A-like [Heteronotia binoei]|uniref:granzyme A-like n=1 Tax=Heteronotia binoei TaxID=13085 RepID=UPI00292F2991|nr:granzyme A-like [Heteronotia binoei]
MDLWLVLSFSSAIIFLRMHRGDCADIIGGEKSVPHSRPFMAALMRENVFECGGTLIRADWVLTAAHCRIKRSDKVILGAHSLTKFEKEKQEFQVTKRFRHQMFNRETYENDIMLLKLNKEANITEAVKPIMLPTTCEDVVAQTQCLVVGWGFTKNGGSVSDILREVNVSVVERRICNNKKHYDGRYVTFNMLCAGGVKDTCNGDSGGPLICGRIQRGITSFGESEKCGSRKYPGVYTRLTKKYLRWIKKTVRG